MINSKSKNHLLGIEQRYVGDAENLSDTRRVQSGAIYLQGFCLLS